LNLNGFAVDALSIHANSYKYVFNTLPIGDSLLYAINHLLLVSFKLDYFNISLITFFVSFFGTFFFIVMIKDVEDRKSRFILYILLLYPSFNFFTSGLSKDMLTFFALSIFTYSVYYNKKYLIIISIIITFFIRPYVTFAILFGFLISPIFYFLISKRKKISRRFYLTYFFISILSIYGIFIISDNHLGSFGKYFLDGSIDSILKNLQGHYVDSPLGIPIDTNYAVRLFNYVFFPSLWNINKPGNYFFLILVIENTILLFSILYIFIKNKFTKIYSFNELLGIMSFIILFLILALITSNSGIGIRQKWMVIPFLLLLLTKKKLIKF
jgi:hypothetical protein